MMFGIGQGRTKDLTKKIKLAEENAKETSEKQEKDYEIAAVRDDTKNLEKFCKFR
jgi:hypothetical protein